MKREEAINILRETHDNSLFSVRTALETLIPELKESEDERIRKALVWHLKADVDFVSNGVTKAECLAYLERQKECVSEGFESIWKTEDCKTLLDEGEKLSPRFKEMFKEVCHSWYDKGIEVGEKQKEQKPNFDTHWENGSMVCEQKEQKSAEWRKEDIDASVKSYSDSLPMCGEFQSYHDALVHAYRQGMVNALKSLRPQSKDEIYKEKDEAFKLGKHQLAIKFMNYLDENRSEGKMSLSNGECEDIVKAFKENDWAKIMRYYEKYRPHWKPSEEQLSKLSRIAEGIPDDEDAEVLIEIYEQLVKL